MICEMSCDVLCCDAMWRHVMWCILKASDVGLVEHTCKFTASYVIQIVQVQKNQIPCHQAGDNKQMTRGWTCKYFPVAILAQVGIASPSFD